ncbi:MAG: GAP family protein [Solirubrobacteraceae bacterium]
MLRLIGLVISIGLADSLNPTTIAPALFLATGERPLARVTQFSAAVFGVYLLGGAAIALGPGQLILSLLPHPGREARSIAEIVAGVVMLLAAALLWRKRGDLSQREPPDIGPKAKSSALLGASITAVELPTAFPYFAVITAIVVSHLDPVRQLLLLLLFNLCFVAPLLGIMATLRFAGDRAAPMLASGRDFLQRRWPVVLAVLALLAGVFVILLGATSLVAKGHGRFGRIARHLRIFLKP